jgi:hypothetical protein
VTAALLVLVVATQAATTILNTSIVEVDRAGRTITVRIDAATNGAVDRNRTRKLTVASSAAAGLARLKAGNEVLLTLRGGTVVDIKMAGRVIVVSPAPPAAAGPQQRIPQLPPGATSPASRGVPQLPAGVDPPQARPVPQVAPAGGAIVISGSPRPAVSPAGVVPTRPAVSPVAVRSPKSPGTPKPVVLPSDPPPTPIPSPG